MRWVVAAASGLALLIGAVLFVVPRAGGPQPGAIATRPSEEQCAALVGGRDLQPETISVGWIWASNGYGWGCRYRYADGSTGEARILRRLDPAVDGPAPRSAQSRPPYAEGVRIGRSYSYVLNTHCGIKFAQIDGTFWEADPPVEDNGNPPAGWGNPFSRGQLRLVSDDRAVFEAQGEIAYFKRANAEPPGCQ